MGLKAAREVATIISLIAIPIVVGFMQFRAGGQAVQQQYVSMAVGILQKPVAAAGKDESDNALRSWAVDVINASAPVKLPPSLRKQLGAGSVWLNLYQWHLKPEPEGRVQPIPKTWDTPDEFVYPKLFEAKPLPQDQK